MPEKITITFDKKDREACRRLVREGASDRELSAFMRNMPESKVKKKATRSK